MPVEKAETLLGNERNDREVPDDYGFELALSRLISELAHCAQLQIDYQYITSPNWAGRRLSRATEAGLYRVAVEALHNAVSHASASRICVIVLLQSSKLILLIEDNGCGFDYSSIRKNLDSCRGLIAIEEAVASLGGILTITSRPQEGTMVRVGMDLGGDEKDDSRVSDPLDKQALG